MHRASRVNVTGPLEPYAGGFAAELQRLGYTPLSAALQLRLAAHLSRWLAGAGLAVTALTEQAAGEFLTARRAAGYTQYLHMQSLGPLLGYLRGLDAVPPAPAVTPLTPAGDLLAGYQRHLVSERGLAAGTCANCVRLVRPFLAGRTAAGVLDLEHLTAGDVTAFMVGTARERSPDTARNSATALRSLLRFLHVNGLITEPLSQAVPAVAREAKTHPAKAVDAGTVAAMLAGCDRGTVGGRRDFAIITLLARLGLRAGEVAGLHLDDLDWHAGEIVIHGKGSTRDRLPMPPDAGEAIAGYLQSGRPPSALDRHVFIRLSAPCHGLTAGGVKHVVIMAGERARAGPLTPHRLRHTAATATLAAGAPLAEVSQLLRHRREQTTTIYAKVGTEALRPLARPWPAADQPGGAA